MTIARALTKLGKKLIGKSSSKKKKKAATPQRRRTKMEEKKYQLGYPKAEQAKRKAYKKKHGMFPEDDPRNYPKKDKGAQKAIRKMGLRPQKRAKGGMIISGAELVSQQYD